MTTQKATISLEICSEFDALAVRALRDLKLGACKGPEIGNTVCVEERTVMLASNKKGVFLKDTPSSILMIGSEQELRQYSFDALKRLARAENIQLGKSLNRERVIQALEQLRISKCNTAHISEGR